MHNPAEFPGSDKAVSAYLECSGSAVLKPTVSALQDDAVIGRKLHATAQVGIVLGAVTDLTTLTDKIMPPIFDLFPLAEDAGRLDRAVLDVFVDTGIRTPA